MKLNAAVAAALILACSLPAFGDAPPSHSLIRIFIADDAALRTVRDAGLDFEGAAGSPGGWMEFVASREDLRLLSGRGILYEVVEPDLAAAARRRLASGPVNALGFGTGSMGGYYTLSEVGAQLDSMKLLHPGLITAKEVVGYSIQGRPVWGVKISDNPDTDEPQEPEALYTALIHAREPAGMMTVLYYMWWLLENYGTDPLATWLVDTRQIWFIPVINVDGYAYNEATNPGGGGFWRKNRRNNGDGTYGVDLNRNFGPDYMWNAPNGGSSTATGSDSYRGTFAFSEPESQTIDTFMRLHSIRTCLNYHTFGRYLVCPFGYLNTETPDSSLFREFSFSLTRVNRYLAGTDQQTVNYSTRGNSDDYMYGDTSKFRTFAMTPEAGTSFWPPSAEILPIAQENLPANIYYSCIAGAMPVLSSYALSDSTSAGGFLPGGPFGLSVTVRNPGLAGAGPLTVSFSTDSGELHFAAPSAGISALPSRGDTTLLAGGTVDASAVPGGKFLLFVTIVSADGYTRTDTVTLYTGEPAGVFADDFEGGTGQWFTEGTWGLTTDAHSDVLAVHDSPIGLSPDWSMDGIEAIPLIDLNGFTAARLEFWTKWAIQPVYDFGVIEISTDAGISWSTLRAPLMNAASGTGIQTAGTFGYDGYTPGPGWIRQDVDLTDFVGTSLVLRFELDTDGGDSRDGWYIDDVRVTGYRAPIPGSPVQVSSASLAGADLAFGEWPGATDGIDVPLGESELGPPPSPGTFDARWEIPPTNGSLTDIRAPLSSPGDTNVFTLRLVTVPADYPVSFSWERGGLPPGSWRITDSPSGGGALDADMWKTGSVQLTDPSVTALTIVHTLHATAQQEIADRWNMVSVPLVPVDSAVTALYPDALPHAFAFEGAYVEHEFVSPGTGYWIRNAGASVLPLTGVPYTRNVVSGGAGTWRLIGSVWCRVPRTAVCPSCGTTPVLFGYKNGYYVPDTLTPGQGYWYHGTGTLAIDCASAGDAASSAHKDVPDPYNLLYVSDGGGGFTALRFGSRTPAGEEPGSWDLPPVPPAPSFDARFETGSAAARFDPAAPGPPVGIAVSNARGDVTLRCRSASPPDPLPYALDVTDGRGNTRRYTVSDGCAVTVPPGSTARLLPATGEVRPSSFRVYGNYPNPFNPWTSIRYDLPSPAHVTLRVRNIAGQEVDVPVRDVEMPAGSHVLRYDAGGLATGVYVYTLTASGPDPSSSGSYTGRFMLVK